MTTCQIRGPVFVACMLGTFATGGAGGAEPALYDVLISGGTIYDGSGARPVHR